MVTIYIEEYDVNFKKQENKERKIEIKENIVKDSNTENKDKIQENEINEEISLENKEK